MILWAETPQSEYCRSSRASTSQILVSLVLLGFFIDFLLFAFALISLLIGESLDLGVLFGLAIVVEKFAEVEDEEHADQWSNSVQHHGGITHLGGDIVIHLVTNFVESLDVLILMDSVDVECQSLE